MELLTSKHLQDGYVAQKKRLGSISQPLHMIHKIDKDEEWLHNCIDWYEHLGVIQLKYSHKRILKNYHLAKGIIDPDDYIPKPEEEFDPENPSIGNILNKLIEDDELPEALNIQFFPIIPNVINVLKGEFSKRNTKISVKAVDPLSESDVLNKKYEEIKSSIEQSAMQDLFINMINSGYEPKTEEEFAELEQKITQEVKSLPHIQDFYKKNYRSTIEKWAHYQLENDFERFNMFQLENMAFEDYLITDSEFWHVCLSDNDYNLELWSPLNTFYHKSSNIQYISEGDYAGRITLMSVPEVINRYKKDMSIEDAKSLEYLYQNEIIPKEAGTQPDQYYDTSRSKYDQEPNSVNYEKLIAHESFFGLNENANNNSFFKWLSTGNSNIYERTLCRVTELYFKTQTLLGFLTKIDYEGNIINEIVTEDYCILDKPMYDTLRKNEKTSKNLIFGEHIDWFWVNEVYGATKINTILSTTLSTSRQREFNPIYINAGPIPFQFTSETALWDSKLPVEGISCTNTRLNKPISITDLMKPYQIIYNLMNNQIKDLAIDELGTVIMLDQNYIPKHSMGEDWGKGNFSKAYLAMKDFSILPLDSSIDNLEGQSNFNHFQMLNLEQSNRFMSRLNVANWAKNEAFAIIGITPQRMGSIVASETATATQAAINNSYAQTETYFINHINNLMPRVCEMLINAAQFYQSKKDSVKINYTNSEQENIFFEIEGSKLLSRDLKIYTGFKPNLEASLKEMKSLIINNNTTNASIYDLLKIYSAGTITELLDSAKKSVEDFNMLQEQQRAHEQEMLDKQLQSSKEQDLNNKQFTANENQKDRDNDITKETIRALGYNSDSDINTNKIPDVLEISKFNAELGAKQAEAMRKLQEINQKDKHHLDNVNLKKQEIQSKERMKEIDYKIAKENKTKAELSKKQNKK